MKSLLSKRSAAIQYFKKFFASKNDMSFLSNISLQGLLKMFASMFFISFLELFWHMQNFTWKYREKMHFDSADKETYRMLAARRDQYKHAALKAKHTGDITTATQHVKVAKVTIGTSTSRICSYKCSSCRGFFMYLNNNSII